MQKFHVLLILYSPVRLDYFDLFSSNTYDRRKCKLDLTLRKIDKTINYFLEEIKQRDQWVTSPKMFVWF